MSSFREILLLTTLLCSSVFADDYRLPTIYSPSSYAINIAVDATAFTENSYQYNASVTITLQVTNATKEIQLHSSYEYISISNIQLDTVALSNFTVSNVTDIATISLDTELVVGTTYTLLISYVGTLAIQDMYGFYRSSYTNANNETVYLLATQFEPTYARRAFPCFDEPGLKATFSLSMSYPSGYTAVSNMGSSSSSTANSITTTVFHTSPKMSTYLLAYVISDFTCDESSLNDAALKHSVCSRSSTASSRQWAVEITPSIMDSFNSYTGTNYSGAMTKLDQFAIPDFAAGAMENWGLVTYRETALLWDSADSSVSYKQSIVETIAHELAHQWFGNLVTTQWWSTIFLNEGFATFFENYITHQILPEYELAHQFVTTVVQPVLLTDSSTSAKALQSDASTPSEISSKFDTITYSKGGSILKMVEHILSPAIFQNGVQNYLSSNQFSNTVPTDLWTALQTSVNSTLSSLPADLSTVMENWITKSGYPVIHVTVNGSLVTFTQERFLLSGNDTESKWYVPISFTTSDNVNDLENTLPHLWLTPADTNSTSVTYNTSASSWILVNNKQTGFYRVNYDSTLWSALTTALLQTNFSSIPDINRAQITDDAFNLARANYLTYSKVFDIIQFLTNDTSYHSWYAAIRGFDYLTRRVGLNSTLGKAIGNHLLNLSSTVRTSVPLTTLNSSDHVYTLNQYLVHLWACKLGDENCITTIQSLLEEYKNTSVKPNKDLRRVIYCYGLKYSTNISSDWQFLWDVYQQTELATEKAVLISSLGCAADETILNEYLLKSITDDSGIRSQDAASVFSAVYTNHVDVAFNFLVNNFQAISEKYNSLNAVGNLIKNIAEYFTTNEQLTNLKSFINGSTLDDDLLTAANEAVVIVEQNLNWISQYRSDLLDYYGITENSTETTSTTASTPTTQSTSTSTESTDGGAAEHKSSIVFVTLFMFALSFVFKSP